jgi:radical SAM superfamily enzyme YgiQ (UPF0313 family)
MSERISGLKEPNSRPDIVLVNSPINDYKRIPKPDTEELPAFGLAHIATECEAAGFNVGVLDAETLALTPEETAKTLNEVNPKWVGINMLTPTYSLARRIVVNLREDIPVIAGAAHAKALPEKVLRDPLIGEKIKVISLEDGEFITRGLLENISPEDMEGVAYLDHHGDLIIKPYDTQNKWIPRNLDGLHFADRKFLPGDPFESQGRRETNIVGSRGCPFNCSFCAGAREMLMFGVRNRTPQNLINELAVLKEQDINSVRFIDDLFLANKKRMAGFFKNMIETGLNNHFVWDATGRVNTLSKLDDNTAEMMALSGCREIAIGIESASPRVLQLMDKSIDPDMVVETVSKLSKVGIRIKGYFILGYPSETKYEMGKTVEFMHNLRSLARNTIYDNPITPQGTVNMGQFRGSMFEFRPYPGTPIYNFITGKSEWPEEFRAPGREIPIYSEDDVINSFRPVYMDGLEERQKHNYTTDHPFTEAMPYEIQEMIADAMITQREDMEKHGEYLPGIRVKSNHGTVYSSREVESH